MSVKKYSIISLLFFVYGIVTALINVFTMRLIFHMKTYSVFGVILLLVLAILPIVGFIVLLWKVLWYLKKNIAEWKFYQNLLIIAIALIFTILPYYIF